ncbi:motility associated factor glycosyltransferase family protein [Virgibacillus doumboii]|uniref:motility associated factor glycosyltransferase family protein n=1 Tax=Virgibacillus doumboii TaxID=2697503 RepID=UPI0013DEFE8D|nr:6-hydroxymethylpterin diphosphokinase MptE-like protein [Virgibacillus doumboii]
MLIDNTLFLRKRYPEVRKYYLEHADELEVNALEVLDSKSGQKTMRYSLDDNGFMVHSLYDPKREADRIIASHKNEINSDTHVFFYGVGLGYHIEKFKELFPDNSYSIYEPVPEIFYSMTEYKMLDSIVTKNTKNLYLDIYGTESNTYLNEFNTYNKNMHLIILPSYENIAQGKVADFREKIKKVIRNRRTGLHTNAKFQKRWVTNSLQNFKEVLDTPNMMKNINQTQFEGKPAIIVSAGPSLAEDMDYIKYIKDNNLAHIFSVGSAINSLIAHDVLPDVVCTYDPSELNYEVFKQMNDNQIDYVPMLFGSSVGYETLRKYNGPKVHFITSQDQTSIYLLKEQLDLESDLILDSPSIAVMTLQILNKLRANPVIFAGQNLGYKNDQIYSEGIKYERHTHEFIQERLKNTITTKDVYGNEIKTRVSFINMKENIEKFVNLYKDTSFVNTTKGGAAINGVPFKPIENVINKLLTEPIQKEKWWHEHNEYSQNKINGQLGKLDKSITDFYDLLSYFEKLLSSISSCSKLRNKHKLEDFLARFDVYYSQLNENIYYRHFLSWYIRVHVQFLANEINRLNQERDPFKKGDEIVYLFSNFIGQCRNGGQELEKVIVNTMEKSKVLKD